MTFFARCGLRKAWGLCCAAAFLLAFAGAPLAAYGQDYPASVRELMRKADAKEPEDGFCATTDWPPSDGAGNDDFKNKAVVGMRTWDLFDKGATCGSAHVTEVNVRRGEKCVRYQWWACARGKLCATGMAHACQNAQGRWQNAP